MLVHFPTHHLHCDHEDALQTERPVAQIEEILEGGSQELHHEGVVLAARAIVVHLRDTHWEGW